MRIENWAIVTLAAEFHLAPEMQNALLQGQVFGHPRFNDGHVVMTSSIVGKNDKNEILTHSGSVYELGEINPTYESQFPNARKRFLNSLTVVQ